MERPGPAVRYSDERRARDNQLERDRMRDVYDGERAYERVRGEEPERAVRIEALVSTLRFAPELKSRERAFLALGRAIHVRAVEERAELHRAQEDNVMAFALLARERDDEHHIAARTMREDLVRESRGFDGPMRTALLGDLRELLSQEASRDAAYLRREMTAAAEMGALDDARVLALALETHPHRPFVGGRAFQGDADTHRGGAFADEGRTHVGERDLRGLESELLELRARHALHELSAVELQRGERVVRVLAAVKDPTHAPGFAGQRSRGPNLQQGSDRAGGVG
jgi:hypothetical protein